MGGGGVRMHPSHPPWLRACIGKVVKESDTMVTANFLDWRADGDYQLKKNQEEVDKALVF